MKKHLIGIGGVGMSALATALVRLGDEVTGADRTLGTPNIRFLESLGVRVFPDDGSGVDEHTDEVIVSTAIEETNAGLRKAQSLGIPVTHRAKALARALEGRKLIAVVGTCGKSTVTAMLGHVLAACGLDPLCVNGANVPGWEGAVRFGKGEYAVAEVDESDKSLVAFSPYAAIVTNASADHYSKEEMDEVFDAFVKDCEGPVVDGREEVGKLRGCEVGKLRGCEVGKLRGCEVGKLRGCEVEKLRGCEVGKLRGCEVGKLRGCEVGKLRGCEVGKLRGCEVGKLRGCEVEKLRKVQPLPGAHNLQNATLAIAMAKALGVDPDQAIAAMKTFRGVERRLQLVSQPLNLSTSKPAPAVYDDYAHNPEKLKAMWTTLAEKHPGGICVIWRPHGYAPLRKMMDALAAMFAETIRPQDRLLLLPVYDAGGTTDRSVNSDALVGAIADRRSNGSSDFRIVELVADLDAAYAWCAAHKSEYAAFVTCGARDPGLPVLARRLSEM